MSEDLLRRLAQVAREDRQAEDAELDGRWDALSAGALPGAEAEELRAEARESPPSAVAYEAFRPLGADFHARVAEAARFQLRPAAKAVPASPAVAARGRRPRWWLPGSALAAAATLLLVFWPANPLPPLPAYELHLAGYDHSLRSPEEEPVLRVFTPGNRLELVLRPSHPVEGPVAALLFVSGDAGPRPLAIPAPEISIEGSVRVVGEVGSEVRLPAGDGFLLVVVGRPGELPSGDELRSRLGADDHLRTETWTAWKVLLRTVP